MKINPDLSDLLFRGLFCLIFIGLGGEHLFSDDLLQRLMPAWVPVPRLISSACGVWLVGWGGLILLGWKLNWAATALGAFLLVVTFAVHLPGLFFYPPALTPKYYWLWDILQRSNLVKNICLLGVCFQLLHHRVGRFGLEHYLQQQRP
jgi:uncharacterized membrane protein YphA (DoxX/SURF4 family)